MKKGPWRWRFCQESQSRGPEMCLISGNSLHRSRDSRGLRQQMKRVDIISWVEEPGEDDPWYRSCHVRRRQMDCSEISF